MYAASLHHSYLAQALIATVPLASTLPIGRRDITIVVMPGVEGRKVLITGGNRGIGMAAAKLFRERAAKVCVVARTEATLKSSGFAYVVADLSTQEGCTMAVERAIELLGGPIDVLVCNHGIGSAHEKPLHLTDIHEWKSSMDTNLIGPFYLTRAVMPMMVEQRYGRIVYTSSTAATEAEPEAVGYNTSKAGLCGLMRSVAQDGGRYNITGNAVLPGWVKTEMADKSALAEAGAKGTTTEEIWKERAALYPAQRVVMPEEVAHTILFLSSVESSGVSGESIRVSGGCPW